MDEGDKPVAFKRGKGSAAFGLSGHRGILGLRWKDAPITWGKADV
jgi:hypothetical protein